MRISATLTALTLAISGVTASAAEPESFGGFLGMTGSYIQTSDIDETDFAAKIVFGPNITENLSLEFGLMENILEFPGPIADHFDQKADSGRVRGTGTDQIRMPLPFAHLLHLH